MILCDTGPLVAAAITTDIHHAVCEEFFSAVRMAGQTLLVPATVVAETGYLLAAKLGWRAEALFLESFAQGDLAPVELLEADYERMAALVRQYADLPLGTTDASLIALAERLGVEQVATLDRRHFTVVRPQHVEALTLLPAQL
ncbi:MAG: PIN domain-containing protein [Propionibacteriaceae bacterium]|nr:PIN domain-containing protein [Propionibacteriaceae bacterium]